MLAVDACLLLSLTVQAIAPLTVRLSIFRLHVTLSRADDNLAGYVCVDCYLCFTDLYHVSRAALLEPDLAARHQSKRAQVGQATVARRGDGDDFRLPPNRELGQGTGGPVPVRPMTGALPPPSLIPPSDHHACTPFRLSRRFSQARFNAAATLIRFSSGTW